MFITHWSTSIRICIYIFLLPFLLKKRETIKWKGGVKASTPFSQSQGHRHAVATRWHPCMNTKALTWKSRPAFPTPPSLLCREEDYNEEEKKKPQEVVLFWFEVKWLVVKQCVLPECMSTFNTWLPPQKQNAETIVGDTKRTKRKTSFSILVHSFQPFFTLMMLYICKERKHHLWLAISQSVTFRYTSSLLCLSDPGFL